MLRAVILLFAAATIWLHASESALAQTSSSSRQGAARPLARKPPPKPSAKKQSPKSGGPKAPPASGIVVKRDAPAVTFRGPVFDENANALSDITEALLRAKADNRRVLIHWGVNGNAACRTLHTAVLNDATLRRIMLYEYELVLIDVSSRTRNLDLALSHGVSPQASGVPWITVLSAQGQAIANLHAGRFIDSRGGIDVPGLAEFLRGYQAMYRAADDLVHAALADARAVGKPLLIQFTSPGCSRCAEVQRWFERPDVDSILARNFRRVRIDVDRTVGGRDVLRRYSHAWQTAIPWFALVKPPNIEPSIRGRPASRNAGKGAGAGAIVDQLDIEGTVLATSDCLDGKSIATLADDEAIERFGDILRSHALILTPAELTWLLQTLRGMNAPTLPAAPVTTSTDRQSPVPATRPAAGSSS